MRSTRPASGGQSRFSGTLPSGTGTSCTQKVVAHSIPAFLSWLTSSIPLICPASRAFGVQACYTFHGYSLADVTQVALVGGVTGQAMSYTSQQYGSWSIVYWIIPVKMDDGSTSTSGRALRPEFGSGRAGEGTHHGGGSSANLGGSLNPSSEADRALINNRTFLVAFADQDPLRPGFRARRLRTPGRTGS